MKKKKKSESKAKTGHAHGAHGRSREGTLARLIAEAKEPERVRVLPPEPLKPLEARVVTPPEPRAPASARLPLLEALASPSDSAAEVSAGAGSGSGRTLRRSAMAVMALVAAAACVFGVARKCAAPSDSEAIDASAIEAGPESAAEEPATLLA
jgi:hypothetical protein